MRPSFRDRLRTVLQKFFFILAALRRRQPPCDALGSKPSVDHWTTRDWSDDVYDYSFGSTKIRYLDYGSGSPVVLLHGMACCWQWWLECIPTLAQHHQVIAVDLPGFGDSTPLPAPASMDDHADAVASLIGSLGINRIAVVGHSMGGLVASSLARRYPDLVARLVLVDAGGVPMSEQRLRAVLAVLRVAHGSFTRPSMLRLLATNRNARRLMLRGAMADPGVMSDELAAVVMPKLNAPAFLDAIQASAIAVRDSRPETLEVRTSLIWGERDMFAPVHTARDMLRRLPDGNLEVLDGLGHSPMVEAPQEFCEALLKQTDFMDDSPATMAN